MRAVEQGELIADRYLVQGFLGMGIVSVVYLAIDINEARPVAVKMLRSRFLEMPGLSAPGSMYPMASLLPEPIVFPSASTSQASPQAIDRATGIPRSCSSSSQIWRPWPRPTTDLRMPTP